MEASEIKRKYAKFVAETMDFKIMEEIVYNVMMDQYRNLTEDQMKSMIIEFCGEGWFSENGINNSKES